MDYESINNILLEFDKKDFKIGDKKYERSPSQIDIHSQFIKTFLENNFKFIDLPRRDGKTVAIVTFCVALMISKPNIEISLFTTGKRHKKHILNLIKFFIDEYYGDDSNIHNYNCEEIILTSKSKCYVTSMHEPRGTCGDLIMIDEPYFMEEGFYNNIIQPFLQLGKPLIGVGTRPEDEIELSKIL